MKSLLTTTAALAMLGAADAQAEPAASEAIVITRNGTQASTQGSVEYFTGRVRVDPLFQPQARARTSAALVTFEPGARTAWHTHPLGQTLYFALLAGKRILIDPVFSPFAAPVSFSTGAFDGTNWADSVLPGTPGTNPSNASPPRAMASRIDC